MFRLALSVLCEEHQSSPQTKLSARTTRPCYKDSVAIFKSRGLSGRFLPLIVESVFGIWVNVY